jgi:hypothetical protein
MQAFFGNGFALPVLKKLRTSPLPLSVNTLDESRKSGQAGVMRGAIRAASYRATFWEKQNPDSKKPA